MSNITFGVEFLNELEAETAATRKCIERVPVTLYEWRPHEKSMNMGYLTHLVAEIPNWITHMILKSEIDLGTYQNYKATSASELVKHFERNIEGAKKALKDVTNERLKEPFYLKHSGQVIFTSSIKENIGSSINHMVHHRGQLTVYLRLNNLPVPSIYGPSADDKNF